MKLHIPVRLFRAVVAAMTALPVIYSAATAAEEIVYTEIPVTSTEQVTGTEDTKFILGADLSWDAQNSEFKLVDSGSTNWYFTSSPENQYSFSLNGSSVLPVDLDSLTIEGMKSLEMSSNVGDGAVSASDYVTLTKNSNITFSENVRDGIKAGETATGAAIHSEYLVVSSNGEVLINENQARGRNGNNSYGGGISAGHALFSNNTAVRFCENKAISNATEQASTAGAMLTLILEMSGNDLVEFIGNETNSSSGQAAASALYSVFGSAKISGNTGNVRFTDNLATGATRSLGGAAAVELAPLNIDDNKGNVEFSRNKAGLKLTHVNDLINNNGENIYSTDESWGGALCIVDIVKASGDTLALQTLSICGNEGNVIFNQNEASAVLGLALGGSIAAFDRNNYDSRHVNLSNNLKSVSFTENAATSAMGTAMGGAIYAEAWDVIMNGNQADTDKAGVEFIGNTAHASTVEGLTSELVGDETFNVQALGGAIYAQAGDITINNNQSVKFSDNKAVAVGATVESYVTSAFAEGAAIVLGGGDLSVQGNGDVDFSGNMAIGAHRLMAQQGMGDFGSGAIGILDGTATIAGNGDVVFQKNASVAGDSYLLNDIVVISNPTNGTALNLGASADKKIEFHGTVIAQGSVNLNADYTDSNGELHQQTGDIIFTGATTKSDLEAVKEAVTGTKGTVTDEEITASRTSIVYGKTTLNNGQLIVMEGAIYQGLGLEVKSMTAATLEQKSGAVIPTVVLDNGKMIHNGAVSFATGTELSAAGISTLEATTLTMGEGSGFAFALSDGNKAAAALTYRGALSLGMDLMLTISHDGTLVDGGQYAMLTLASLSEGDIPTNWAEGFTISSGTEGWTVTANDLEWKGNTLYLNYSAPTDPSGPTGAVPEPTTATLSLLALAAMAARRRRRK